MLKILHRIVCMTGKYSSRIRASYLTSFIKGIMMKAPLIFSFFAISLFMKGQMNEKICLYLGIGLVICIAVEAVFEHITNVLQSATGYEVFADMRMRLGDHLRKLPMGYFTEGNMGTCDFYDFPGAHDTHDVCHGYTIRGCCMRSHYCLFHRWKLHDENDSCAFQDEARGK